MKITYHFADEAVEIEVDDVWADFVAELDRIEYNIEKKETRRHCSFEAINVNDSYLPSNEDIEADCFRDAEKERLMSAMDTLTARQRYLIEQVYFYGRSYGDIAREEHKHKSSIAEAVQAALKKLKKFLE